MAESWANYVKGWHINVYDRKDTNLIGTFMNTEIYFLLFIFQI